MLRSPTVDAWNGLDAMRPELERYLARRCRDAHQVDDVIQESFLRAARYRRGLTRPERLRPWLLRIATNVLADQARRDRRRRRLAGSDEGLFEVPCGAAAPDEQVDEPELWVAGHPIARGRALGALRRALADAPRADRLVLVAYYGAGNDCRATAQRCRIPVELVKVRLFRARTRLRHALLAEFTDAAAARRAS